MPVPTIYRHAAKDGRLINISDMLSVDLKPHCIAVTIADCDPTQNHAVSARVCYYLEVADAKLVCYDILNGFFAEWTDNQGVRQTDGMVPTRVIAIRKDPKYRQPFVIKIDNGDGDILPGGAVKMMQTKESLTILLSEWDARKMAQTVLDWIRDWEVIHHRKRSEAATSEYMMLADGTPIGFADYAEGVR